MKTHHRFRTLLAFGLTALLTVVGISIVHQARSQAITVTLSPHPAFATQRGNASVADVAERTLPSVVNISSTRRVGRAISPFGNHPLFRDDFRGQPRARPQRGMGSGVIISADGVVITNNHVVAKADNIRVTLWDKREYDAKVIGTDPKSDVAVLRLKGAKNLRPIVIGNSDRIRLGEIVLAIGNPFGVGQTVTMGIVSAKGRANVGIVDYENFIQTDAAINPGNSGGALVNMRGQLVGINTAILSRSGGYQGIGFAIPTNMMKPIAKSLLKTGKVIRGWLGVAIQGVTPQLKRALRLPTRRGVLISDVDPQGPAKSAGVRRGDLVIKINGRAVDSPAKLRNIIASAGNKAKITIDFFRDGKRRSLSLRLGELPARLGGTAASSPEALGGVRVQAITPQLRNRYKIPRRLRYGVVVVSVSVGSKAQRAGLEVGDVILEVNRARIDSVRRFSQRFSAAKGQTLLLVYRRGFTQYLLMYK